MWKINTQAIPPKYQHFFLSKALLKNTFAYYLPSHDSLYRELLELMKDNWKINVGSHLKAFIKALVVFLRCKLLLTKYLEEMPADSQIGPN